MEQIDKLIKMVDDELEYNTPGSDEWRNLLHNREDLLRQKDMVVNKSSKRKPSPDTILQCATCIAQILGVAALSYLARPDKNVFNFMRRP